MVEENKPAEQEQKPAEIEQKQTEELSPLEQVKKINEDNKEILKQITEERKKIEKAAAEVLIGGRSTAGQAVLKISPEEKIKTETKELFKGTMIESAFK